VKDRRYQANQVLEFSIVVYHQILYAFGI